MTITLKNADRTSELLSLVSSALSDQVSLRYASRRVQPYSSPDSRYLGHRVVIIERGSVSYRTIETWERPPVPPVSSDDKYFYVDYGYAYRPDKIALTYYGSERLDWWVLVSNGLRQDEDVVPGMTLRLSRPPTERINTVQGIIS